MLNKPWVDCNGGLYLVFPSILKKKKNQPFCPLADIFKNGNEGRNAYATNSTFSARKCLNEGCHQRILSTLLSVQDSLRYYETIASVVTAKGIYD